jgi:DNA-binding transcriptional LysR family regulator
MLPHLQHIMDEAEVTRTLADNFKLLNQVPVRVGVMSTVGHVGLSCFLAEFQKDFEGVEVAVNEADGAALGAKLQDGELDLAVLNPREVMADAFEARELYRERYVVVSPPGHKLAALDAIKLSDLSRERYVDRLACEMRELVMAACDEMDVELYARFRSEREDWVQAMVQANIGFAFMPEYSVTLPELLRRPLIDPIVERTICLINAPGRPFTPAVAAFVRAAKRFDWPA